MHFRPVAFSHLQHLSKEQCTILCVRVFVSLFGGKPWCVLSKCVCLWEEDQQTLTPQRISFGTLAVLCLKCQPQEHCHCQPQFPFDTANPWTRTPHLSSSARSADLFICFCCTYRSQLAWALQYIILLVPQTIKEGHLPKRPLSPVCRETHIQEEEDSG